MMQKRLLFSNRSPWKRRPPLCHPERSRDLQFSGPFLEMFFENPSVEIYAVIRYCFSIIATKRGFMVHKRMLAGIGLAIAMQTAVMSQEAAMPALRPDQVSFLALYKELVETNTTLSAGSCTLAAGRTKAGQTERNRYKFAPATNSFGCGRRPLPVTHCLSGTGPGNAKVSQNSYAGALPLHSVDLWLVQDAQYLVGL
jgi:hypothetical protein